MKNNQKFFLAANSCEGFISHFSDNYDCFDGWRAYIIKGGPGTGKSSFMKKIVSKCNENNINTILCPCSSDPNSLDGVIIEEKKIIILDGTAPHIVEPSYPGACENIINLGDYWDSSELYEKRDAIYDVTLKNKLLHKAASRYLIAAGYILSDMIKITAPFVDAARVKGFADGLSNRIIPKKINGDSKEWVRFVGGITPEGIISYKDTIKDNYENIIVISDRIGCVSSIITDTIRRYALDMGWEIISLKNPFLPSYMYDHILIPELSLAVVTENDYFKLECEERKIHARRFTDINHLNCHREKLRFNSKIFKELINSACKILAEAKNVHDDLEKIYINAMDFEKMNSATKKLFNEINL